MSSETSRRDFLKATVAGAAAGALPLAAGDAGASPEKLPLEKGIVFSMLPRQLSYPDRFKMLRDAGFQVTQVSTTPDPREAEAIKKAADAAGIRIDSVMNMAHWKYPLSSADPAVVKKSMEGMRTSLHNAHLWGSDAVLLVPAVVNAQTGYREAWLRSQRQIRKLIPLAEQLKVVIAIEEVWNKFLLSPLEMARYIDEFRSPWIKSWFDVGNVVFYGYPQDWIQTLGKRIAKLHLKDFKRSKDCYAWVDLGDGDIMWPAVRSALQAIGYSGSAICELKGGDEAYLRDLSQRVDRLLIQA
ncbi:MAG TPA: sugar phosphate isomerase/epimerase family protein [Terriglobia bacterium]|nr:sugar phosphate isomerase/epimerase family protein [Terriglobia bacterium]